MARTLRHASRWTCALAALALACSTGGSTPKGGRTVLMSDEGEPAMKDEKPKPGEQPKQPVLVTRGDDRRAGAEYSKQIEGEMGIVGDDALAAYVQELGTRLARAVPRSRGYEFRVVDQVEPNAFALPGGYIYVSRGLLALTNTEDELANVVGHEITHAARRHSARQQAVARAQPGLSMPWVRAKNLAAYGRDMEREADKGGQQIAAASGYDPMGMSTFLANLEQSERLMRGYSRVPYFFDTHPGTRERAGVNAVRAREIRWTPNPAHGDTRARYLERVDGLALGQRPEAGLFKGRHFIHPGMDFQLLFPAGWETQNTGSAVGAREPKGDAVIFLEADPPAPSLEQAAQKLLDETPQGTKLTNSQPVAFGGFDAWRLEITFPAPGSSIHAMVTLIDAGQATFRITGVVRGSAAKRFRGRLLATPRTFRRLKPEQLEDIRVTRLRLVKAQPGERLADLSGRTGNAWSLPDTAVLNGFRSNHIFEGGEFVKIAREERWTPSPPPAAFLPAPRPDPEHGPIVDALAQLGARALAPR